VTAGRRARLLLGALTLLLAPATSRAITPALAVTWSPAEPRPGDVLLIRVPAAPADLAGDWDGRPLQFFRLAEGAAALVGIDLDATPGPVAWRLTRPTADGGRHTVRTGTVKLRPRTFETQRLTLPSHQVDLDAATLARVKREQAELRAALAAGLAERLWRGPFLTPVEGGQPTGGFGLRRVINGQPRSSHTGYDWGAPVGTPVLAANGGRVALVADFFFSGRLVVLDHGLGLFTHYYHLDAVEVAAGEQVVRGQPIGRVGVTGRVTGPHLHFAVSLGGARVDPLALLGLGLPPEPS
jgi:murein DD-endopeptidase MepM/ murein hydrolase activator NlpD